ncbi:MAG: RNA methyltransferase [Caldilineae bacterium]|nr:MAG: RNA methyltransferase [Caldilineae bacterium]
MTVITSTRNPKIVALRKLSQRKHRRAQNRFAVEGLQLLGMALEGGHAPLDIFYCPAHFAGATAPALLERLIAAGGRAHAVSPAIMQALSERDAPQGLIATFPLFQTPLPVLLDALPDPALLVVLDRLQDPGNVGTLLRTADAVAAGGVILIEPCADPFDPKTVRGSMGSLFTVPLARTTDPPTLFAALKERGFKCTAADGYRGDIPWQPHTDALRGSVALFLGNEARGLSDDLRPHLTHWVRLPMPGHAESLNVAVAGGVLMYYWLAQNTHRQPPAANCENPPPRV